MGAGVGVEEQKMRSVAQERRQGRLNRHRRIRRQLRGTAEQPRLAIFRSSKHLYAQIIDDDRANTLVAISTVEKAIGEQLAAAGSGLKRSRELGKLLAHRAKERGITQVAFDRGGYLYHGHVKELAEGAREGGLKF
jgi:large subunit ribosomal protein L18